MPKANKAPHLSNVYNASVHVTTAFSRYINALDTVADKFPTLREKLEPIMAQVLQLHNDSILAITSHKGNSLDDGRKHVHRVPVEALIAEAKPPQLSDSEKLQDYEETLSDELASKNLNPQMREFMKNEIIRLRALGVKLPGEIDTEKVFLKGIL